MTTFTVNEADTALSDYSGVLSEVQVKFFDNAPEELVLTLNDEEITLRGDVEEWDDDLAEIRNIEIDTENIRKYLGETATFSCSTVRSDYGEGNTMWNARIVRLTVSTSTLLEFELVTRGKDAPEFEIA